MNKKAKNLQASLHITEWGLVIRAMCMCVWVFIIRRRIRSSPPRYYCVFHDIGSPIHSPIAVWTAAAEATVPLDGRDNVQIMHINHISISIINLMNLFVRLYLEFWSRCRAIAITVTATIDMQWTAILKQIAMATNIK